jgi:flagellar hook-associated protein 1 FlgK
VSGSVATDVETTGSIGTGNLALVTANGNVVPAGGTIGAVLTGVNVTIPTYQSALDSIADSVATGLNSLQSGGVSAGGVPGATSAAAAPPYAGTLLPSIFVNGGSTTTYTTGAGSAATISINPTLAANPSLIATAAGTSPAGAATIDPTTAQAMAKIGSSPTGPDALYQSLVALVGTQTARAQDNQTSTQTLANSTAAQQSSVEGVNTNEETVNMLAAQQNYQALASVISSATSAIESLLNAVA